MNSVKELKVAAEKLSARDKWELYRWLGNSKDVQRFRHEELRREIALGLEQADCGDLAPIDVSAMKREVRNRLAGKAR